MKKKLIFSVATATLLSASAVLAGGPEIIPVPDYFSGFYVGGTVSVHNMTTEQSSSFISNTDLSQSVSFLDPVDGVTTVLDFALPASVFGAPLLAESDVDGATVNVYGGVQGGFGKVFSHRFYLGVVGFGEFGKQQATTTNSTNAPYQLTITTTDTATGDLLTAVSNVGDVNISTSTTTQLKNDYGVAAKLGYLFTPTTMLYGKIGAVWADMEVSTSMNGTADASVVNQLLTAGVVTVDVTADSSFALSGSSSTSDTQSALLLGIGLEQFVYSDIVSLSLEYDYAKFGTIDTTGNVTATSTGLSGTLVDSTITTPVTVAGTTSPLNHIPD